MQSHELQTTRRTKKRIGRGGKRGTTAGRGTKGQKSRSGGNVNPLFQGGRSSLIQQMKKLRGFKAFRGGKKAISLNTLDKEFADGESVTISALQEKKIIRANDAKNGIKVVSGKVSKKLTIDADIALTATAKDAIEKAGGTCKEQPQREPRNARKVPLA